MRSTHPSIGSNDRVIGAYVSFSVLLVGEAERRARRGFAGAAGAGSSGGSSAGGDTSSSSRHCCWLVGRPQHINRAEEFVLLDTDARLVPHLQHGEERHDDGEARVGRQQDFFQQQLSACAPVAPRPRPSYRPPSPAAMAALPARRSASRSARGGRHARARPRSARRAWAGSIAARHPGQPAAALAGERL